MALSILPHLMTTSAKKNQVKNDIVILTATSGDTGKAALAGFADVPAQNYCILSEERCQPGSGKTDGNTERANTLVVAIHGNFDHAQTGVKKMFKIKNLEKNCR